MLCKIKWFVYLLVTDPFKKLKRYLYDLWLKAWARANDDFKGLGFLQTLFLFRYIFIHYYEGERLNERRKNVQKGNQEGVCCCV